jgi:hypothetical protein
MAINLEKYNRKAVCCNLDEFDPMFASGDDFIEVCEWKMAKVMTLLSTTDTIRLHTASWRLSTF